MITTRKQPARRKQMKPASRPRKGKGTGRRAPLGLLLLGLVALFVLYMLVRDYILPLAVRTHSAEPGFMERSVSTDAVIIRQETVFAAPVSGKIMLRAKEGERVRSGVPVVEITNPQASRVIDDQITQVNQRLTEFDKNNGQRLSALEKTARELNVKIAETIEEARKAQSLHDWDRLAVLDVIARESMEKRALAATDLERIDNLRNDILGERQRLAEVSKKAQNIMEAPSPGIVSFVIDGQERTFSPLKTDTISARAIFTLQPKSEETRTGDEVKAGKPVFRIITPDQVHFAIPLNVNDIGDVVASQSLRVRSESLGAKPIGARVVSVSDPKQDGFGVVTVSVSPYPEEALRLRKVKLDLIKDRHEGLMIPKKSLTEKNGEVGVYIVYKTMAQFRKIIIKAQDDSRVVIEGISPGTEVITNPWLVREGLKVR